MYLFILRYYWLLGICFVREPLKKPLGRTGGREKWGYSEKEDGRNVAVCREEKSPVRSGKRLTREISRRFSFNASVALQAALPIIFLAAVFRRVCPDLYVYSRNQDAAVVQMDFRCLPCLALVDSIQIGIGWIPWTVEPVEVRFVVRNPLLDRDWQLVMPTHRSKNSASNLAMT